MADEIKARKPGAAKLVTELEACREGGTPRVAPCGGREVGRSHEVGLCSALPGADGRA